MKRISKKEINKAIEFVENIKINDIGSSYRLDDFPDVLRAQANTINILKKELNRGRVKK